MSHFSTVAVEYTNLDAIMLGLSNLGFKPIYNPQGQQLRNDWGTATKAHKAEVVVPMAGKADVGFRYNDGRWLMIADDYELNQHHGNFKRDLALEYAAIQARNVGYQVVREGNEIIAVPRS